MLGSEIAIRLELFSPGIEILSPQGVAPVLFSVRRAFLGTLAVFSGVAGGYLLLPKPDEPTRLPWLSRAGWLLAAVGGAALLVAIWLHPDLAYMPWEEGNWTGLAWLLVYLGFLAASADIVVTWAAAKNLASLEGLWVLGAAALGLAATGLAVSMAAGHTLGLWWSVHDPLRLDSLSSEARIILHAIGVVGLLGASLTLRRNAPGPARLLAVAAALGIGGGLLLLRVLSQHDLDLHVHDTTLVMVPIYASAGGAVIGLLCMLWFRRRVPGVIGWSAAALTSTGYLGLIAAVFALGRRGMPLRYLDYVPELMTSQRVATASSLAWVLGLSLTVVALHRSATATGEAAKR